MSQFKSFIGLVNYYGKFLPDLSNILTPLYKLLEKAVKWSWHAEQQKAFDKVEKLLTSDCLLVHYDLKKKLILACDASPYGVVAVLTHRDEMGQEHPITFASHTLNWHSREKLLSAGEGRMATQMLCPTCHANGKVTTRRAQ